MCSEPDGHACTETRFMRAQYAVFCKAIDEEKYLDSEKAHHDIGWDAAQQAFFDKYFPGVAVGFRICYCSLVCKQSKDCAIGRKYLVDLIQNGGPPPTPAADQT